MSNKIFNIQPNLHSDNLETRALSELDFTDLYAVSADKQMWTDHPDTDRYQQPVFAEWFANAIASKAALVVIDKTSKKIIGTSRYYYYDELKKEVAIGYTFLARAFWGGKTNTELKFVMLDYAFNYVDTVWIHIALDNIRSQTAILRVGAEFSHEGKPHPGLDELRKVYKFTKSNFSILASNKS